MIPDSSLDFKVTKKPSRTYKLNFETKRIMGMVDGYDSVLQAVQKILQTERYSTVLYSGNYGAELEGLIGENYDYICSDIERRIREAILIDNRIRGIENIALKKTDGTKLYITFKVLTDEGDFHIGKELQL